MEDRIEVKHFSSWIWPLLLTWRKATTNLMQISLHLKLDCVQGTSQSRGKGDKATLKWPLIHPIRIVLLITNGSPPYGGCHFEKPFQPMRVVLLNANGSLLWSLENGVQSKEATHISPRRLRDVLWAQPRIHFLENLNDSIVYSFYFLPWIWLLLSSRYHQSINERLGRWMWMSRAPATRLGRSQDLNTRVQILVELNKWVKNLYLSLRSLAVLLG